MKPLPSLAPYGRNAGGSGHMSWDQAIGNVEDALVSVQALQSLVDDAVYLDESAYTGAASISAYTSKIQAQAKRIHELELEVAAVQAEVSAKDRALAAASARHREASAQLQGMQEELDNSSVVFKMHYQELITRNEEIARLNSLVAQLQQQLQQQAHFTHGSPAGLAGAQGHGHHHAGHHPQPPPPPPPPPQAPVDDLI
eukprot:CAMPEP_0202862734 /NCGR_PEP_ID=MMETSP1391-20130828/3670_1 /ASSEMBLY_ACC=CAM_ASM_000867 /TAXON_ID=1034604 /ORGANISM="Chlamydomonas leiostraca, Strain SAG 11-49" /LENGTH=198 /DNA_ID=CAMNT_0049542309 /DNA_START=125 /DNA_END=721 /DNA_ORIENTATION=-